MNKLIELCVNTAVGKYKKAGRMCPMVMIFRLITVRVQTANPYCLNAFNRKDVSAFSPIHCEVAPVVVALYSTTSTS